MTTHTDALHEIMARAWARWNGQAGTAKQAARIMRSLSAETLHKMLVARGITYR